VDLHENKINKAKFVEAVTQFVKNPGNVRINGTFRGEPAIHIVDLQTGLHVSVDPQRGQYLGGWKSDPTIDQYMYLIVQGKI
jgi:hypothetical protein